MIAPAWASNPVADDRSQAARTATLPTAPPRQANKQFLSGNSE